MSNPACAHRRATLVRNRWSISATRILPLEPFTHDEPTALALLDLDHGLAATVPPAGASGKPCRDTLLLVRLHGQPLDVVYLDRPFEELPRTELSELLWAHLAGPLREHAAPSRRHAADRLRPHRVLWRWRPGRQADPRRDSRHGRRIVPTGGRPAQLRRCLAALAEQSGPACEIVVVDNQPRSQETKLVVEVAAARSRHQMRYVAEPRPGSSVARNRGVAQVTAGVVAFTDDDVVVERDWLRMLVAPFARAEVGATTGLVMPLELATPAQKRFELYGGFAKGVRRSEFDLHGDRADHRLLYPFWGGVFGSGNCMAIRRQALVAAGGFDPALGAGSRALAGADIDALSAVILRGARLVYEPRALCWHEHRRDDEALRRQVFNYGVGFTADPHQGAPARPALRRRGGALGAGGLGLRRARATQARDPATTIRRSSRAWSVAACYAARPLPRQRGVVAPPRAAARHRRRLAPAAPLRPRPGRRSPRLGDPADTVLVTLSDCFYRRLALETPTTVVSRRVYLPKTRTSERRIPRGRRPTVYPHNDACVAAQVKAVTPDRTALVRTRAPEQRLATAPLPAAPRVSVVIPALNEAQNLERLLPAYRPVSSRSSLSTAPPTTRRSRSARAPGPTCASSPRPAGQGQRPGLRLRRGTG